MFENIVVVALEVSVVIVGSGIVLFDTDVLVVLKYPENVVEVLLLGTGVVVLKDPEAVNVAFIDIDAVMLEELEVAVGSGIV